MSGFGTNGFSSAGGGTTVTGAEQLIQTYTLDGSTTEFTLPTGYRNFRILIDGAEESANTLHFRVGTAGAQDKTAANYSTQYIKGSSTSFTAIRYTTHTGWTPNAADSLAADVAHHADIILMNPLSTTIKTTFYSTAYARHDGATQTSTVIYQSGGAHHATATAHTRIFIGTLTAVNSSSDLTALSSGTKIYLYGIN